MNRQILSTFASAGTIIVALFALLIISSITLAPDVSSAQGFVPCDGVDCTFCHIIQTGNNILNWLFGVIFVIFGVVVFVAGFNLMTSGGNQSKLDDAKKKLSNALVGIIIIFAAWLIVDTVMKTLVNNGSLTGVTGSLGMWNEISCGIGNQETPGAGQVAGAARTQTCTTNRIVSALSADPPGCTCTVVQASMNSDRKECTCTETRDLAPGAEPGPGCTVDTPTPPTQATEEVCNDDAALMAQYNGSPINTNAPGLNTLISCYQSDPAIAAALDTSQIYTYERSDPRCALTNGNSVCGLRCDHSVNSCHYGRGSGEGAKAVDFNARAGTSESDLNALIRARQSVCGGTVLFETNHTHISLPSC